MKKLLLHSDGYPSQIVIPRFIKGTSYRGLLILLIVFLNVLSAHAWTAVQTTIDGITYEATSASGSTVIAIDPSLESVTIPESYEYEFKNKTYTATVIWLDFSSDNLKSLTISGYVENVKDLLKDNRIPNIETINVIGDDGSLVSEWIHSDEDWYEISVDRTKLINVMISNRTTFSIPESVEIIGDQAFKDCSKLTSIEIPQNVNSIGESAFYGCSSLTSIEIPQNVTLIANNAFYGCSSLEKVILPESLKGIGASAFYQCSNIKYITIPSKVTSIGYQAFYNCSGLNEVILPPSVISVESEAFYGCTNLIKSAYPTTVKDPFGYTFHQFTSSYYEWRSYGVTVGYNPEGAWIEDKILYGPDHIYFVSRYVSGEITLPGTITSIEKETFEDCTHLGSITIPASVLSIGDNAFNGCNNLKSIIIESGDEVLTLGVGKSLQGLFYDCPLEELFIGRPLSYSTNNQNSPFSLQTNLKTVHLDSNLPYITEEEFYGCSGLESIIIPQSIISIGASAFDGCTTLSKAEFASIENLCKIKFSNLTSNPLSQANHLNINGQEVTNIVIPNTVDSIGKYAFACGTEIRSVIIPTSVKSVGEDAFYNCTNLSKAEFANIENICKIKFSNLYSNPLSQVNHLYINGEEVTNIIIPDTVDSIGQYAFACGPGFKSVIIPPSVKSVGKDAFYNCYYLLKSAYPSTIENPFRTGNAFFGASIGYNPEESILENDWIYGPDKASILFAPITLKGDYSVPNTVETIGADAFSDCTELTAIIIPKSVKEIGRYAFSDCEALEKADFASIETLCSIEYGWGSNPLYYAHNLYIAGQEVTDVIIPETVSKINDYAFYGASNITSIVIPASVQSIGYNAFSGCSGLTSVKVNWNDPITYQQNIFNSDTYDNAILDIPVNTLITYMQSDWNQFKNIAVNGYNASRTFDDNVFKYRLIEDPNNLQAVLINGNYESMTEASIPYRFTDDSDPDNPQRYYVTAIGPEAFLNCNKLTKLSIHKDAKISEISTSAFKGCTALTNVSLSPEIKIIADSAFKDCSNMSSISLPGTISTIGDYAFYNCRYLESFNLPENLETIGESAFSMDEKFYSSYRTTNALTIPASLRRIGTDAFHYRIIDKVNIKDLRAWCNIDFESGFSNPGIWSPNGFWFENEKIVDLVIPEGVEAIKQWAFVIQPTSTEWIDHVRKTSGHIKSVKIPNSVKSIEPGSFMWNGFSEITIPASVDSIGDWAFSGYNATFNHNSGNYADITLDPINVTFVDGLNPIEISSEAFSTEINRTCVSGVEASYKTYYSSPEVLYLGRPIDTLPDGFNSSIKTLTIGDILIDMPECNFSKCSNMTNLTIGNGMLEIPAEKFSNLNKLSSVTLGSSVATIGDNAFSGCTGLTTLTVSPSVETIGESAFAGNTRLATINMGHGVTKIGANAFMNCPAKTVAITAQEPPVAPNNTFSDYSGDLYVQDPGDRSILDLYSDSYYCWERFNGIGMVVATRLINESGDIPVKGEPGTKFQLSARIEPDNVTLPKIFWRSTNPLIATVDENGWVTIQDPDAYPEETVQTLSTTYGASNNECKIIAETMYANGPVLEVTVQSDNSGIDEVIADGPVADNGIDYEAPYEVYNMQGMFMGNSVDNLAKGFYIVRQGQVAKKIAVK